MKREMTKCKKVLIIALVAVLCLSIVGGGLGIYFATKDKYSLVATPQGFSQFSKTSRDMASGADYFVSSTAGEDGVGTKEKPFSSIAKAQEKVRERIANAQIPVGGLRVAIFGGEYFEGSLTFDERDSTSPDKPITYMAYDNTPVVINGGLTLKPEDFSSVAGDERARLYPEAQSKVVKVDLAKYGVSKEDYGKLYAIGGFNTAYKYTGDTTGPNACELFYNNERMTLARYPNNNENLSTGKVSDIGDSYEPKPQEYRPEWNDTVNPRGGTFGIDAKTAKRAKKWKNYSDVWIFGYFYWDWADMSTPIKSLDTKKKTLTTEYCSKYGFKKNAPYYFYNVYEELDQEGEWYLDRESGMLYVYPSAKFREASIQLSLTTNSIINVKGAKNLVFDGLNIKAGRASGIEIKGDNNTVKNCEISATAEDGVRFEGSGNKMYSSDITKVGKNGVYVGGGDREIQERAENHIMNNSIHSFAELQRTYAVGVKITGVGNSVSHNEIFEAPHAAIIYEGNDHLIEYNNIHDVVKFSSDAGAIYSGRNLSWYGNVIRFNAIYNIGSDGFSPDGIYFDDALAGQTAYSNLLVNIPKNAILIGGGRDNVVYDNLIINAKTPIYFDGRAYEGFHDGGWYKKHVEKRDANHWKLYDDAKRLNKLWNGKYSGIERMHDSFQNTEDSGFALNPAGSVVKNNLTFSKNKQTGFFAECVKKYATLDITKPYGLGKEYFVNFKGGDYKFSEKLKGEQPNFEEIPIHLIGRY